MIPLTQRGERLENAAMAVTAGAIGYLAMKHGSLDIVTHLTMAAHNLGIALCYGADGTATAAREATARNTIDTFQGAGLAAAFAVAASLRTPNAPELL